MSAIFVCDGCGKQTESTYGSRGRHFTPSGWYSQSDYDTGRTLDVCSRECIKKVAEKEGVTDLVIPL